MPRIGGRDALRILLVAIVSFEVNQLPYLLTTRKDAIGDNGDSAFHVAIQMKLRDPQLFAKDVELTEMNMASRPAFEFWIHRAVGWVAQHVTGERLLAANIAVFWAYHLVFLAGCYFLGRWFLRSEWGGTLFALLSTGASWAMRYSWGMVYAAVIPHDVALSLAPWFILAFLAWNGSPARIVLLHGLLGLAANVYPLQPLYLAIAFLGVLVIKRRIGLAFVAGLAFLAGAAPIILLSAVPALTMKRAALDAAQRAVLDRMLLQYYGDLIPTTHKTHLKNLHLLTHTPVWIFLAAGALGAWWKAKAGAWSVADRLLARFTAAIGLLTIIGLFGGALFRPLVLFLFVRASGFLYVAAYLYALWMAGQVWTRRTPLMRSLAVVLLLLMLVNAWRLGIARRIWIDRKPAQPSTGDFQVLCLWAKENTPESSLFLVPPYSVQGTYYGMRVYGERGITLQGQMGEIALSAPQAAVRWERMYEEVTPLYSLQATTEDFLRVARDLGADFILTDAYTPSPPHLLPAFHVGPYTVYVVPPR